MEEIVHRIFTAYEMRFEKKNPSRKDAAFEASKNTKRNKHEKNNQTSSHESNDEEANFVKKHKEGCGTCTKVRYLLNVLNVVKQVTLLLNALIKKEEIVMMRKIIIIRKEEICTKE